MEELGAVGLGLAKTAAVEVIKNPDKISKFFGVMFPFVGLKKAAVDAYVDAIQKSDLPPEYKLFSIANTKKTLKEMQNQAAVIENAYRAAKEGTDFSEKSAVKDEFLSRFLDSAKHVSDEQAQLLWGNVLAGEFEKPGSAPSNIIRILSELSEEHAVAFSNLCSMLIKLIAVDVDGFVTKSTDILLVPAHIDWPENCPSEIPLNVLKELETYDLINCGDVGYDQGIKKDDSEALYCLCEDQILLIPNYKKDRIAMGNVLLTSAGRYLSRFIEPKPLEGYYSAIMSFFKHHHILAEQVTAFIEETEDPVRGKAIRFQRKDTVRQ